MRRETYDPSAASPDPQRVRALVQNSFPLLPVFFDSPTWEGVFNKGSNYANPSSNSANGSRDSSVVKDVLRHIPHTTRSGAPRTGLGLMGVSLKLKGHRCHRHVWPRLDLLARYLTPNCSRDNWEVDLVLWPCNYFCVWERITMKYPT